MNKFIAILKDSYREAVDGWIFFLMLILSGIVILLIASISLTPVPMDQALPSMVTKDEMMFVQADRGNSPRIGRFFYQVSVTDAVAGTNTAKPWQTEARFTIQFNSLGFGPTGIEMDNLKNPKEVKQIDGELFASSFMEAARYWANKPGSLERPKYTEELAKEFVTYQLRSIAGLNVKTIDSVRAGEYKVMVDGAVSEKAWIHKPSLFFGALPLSFYQRPLGQLVYRVESTLVNGVGAWVILLTGVIVTAAFIPNMLRKGTIDLWLTKPLSRLLLLFYKYLGGLLFVFLITTSTIAGVWFAIGLRTGIWSTGILTCVFGITFYFAILYACSTLIGVLTRNAIVSIIATILFWSLLFLIGVAHSAIMQIDSSDIQFRQARDIKKPDQVGKDKAIGKDQDVKNQDVKNQDVKNQEPDIERPQPVPDGEFDPTRVFGLPKWLVTTSKIVNSVTPRTNDLDNLTTLFIARGLVSEADEKQSAQAVADTDWVEVIVVSLVWILLFLGLAAVRFVTRSY